METYYEKGRLILKKLLDLNYQAFFVGGYVRDFLLSLKPNDIDITTNALPEDIQKIFPKTKATGIKYGTILVFEGNYQFEVTTFRADLEYIDHRKPKRVVFSKVLEEDLKRRDFTVNALAMDYNEKIIDLYNGKLDLKNKLIKAIGNPEIRFREDALRMLRAFRFVSKLGFDIEKKTFESIKKNIKLLTKISNERILIEIKKILNYPYYKKALSMLEKANIHQAFPELLKGLKILSKAKNYRLNYLEFFALCFFEANIEIPNNWRFSNKDKDNINKIVELVLFTKDDVYNEMIIYRLGKDIPLMANNVSTIINPSNNQEALINKIYDNLPIYKTCDLKFKGQDILALTALKNAKIIGKVIDDITYQIITNKLSNDFEKIKAYVVKLLEKKYEKE